MYTALTRLYSLGYLDYAFLGLRPWTRASVLRTAPCLLGLFTVVSLLFHEINRGKTPRPRTLPWYEKTQVTFADAMASVRRLLWRDAILQQASTHGAFQNLPRDLREMLLDQLSLAT